jgi:hypothetical protein
VIRSLPGALLRDRRPLLVLVGLVLANYAAQVPYDLHLYGVSWNRRGALLLGATLVWFGAGLVLLLRGSAAGAALLLSFLALEFVFYFRNEVLLIPAGYGLPYHLAHARDPLLWTVFLVGDLNFLAAGSFLAYVAWGVLSRISPNGSFTNTRAKRIGEIRLRRNP